MFTASDTLYSTPSTLTRRRVFRLIMRYALVVSSIVASHTQSRLYSLGSKVSSPPFRCFFTPPRQVMSRTVPSFFTKVTEKNCPVPFAFSHSSFATLRDMFATFSPECKCNNNISHFLRFVKYYRFFQFFFLRRIVLI